SKSSMSTWSACRWHFLPPNGSPVKDSISPWPGFRLGLKPWQEAPASEHFADHPGCGGIGAGRGLRLVVVIVAARLGTGRTRDLYAHSRDFLSLCAGSLRAGLETRHQWFNSGRGDLRQLVRRPRLPLPIDIYGGSFVSAIPG